MTATLIEPIGLVYLWPVTGLGSTWIIQQIWNSLSRDVPKLPRLSYLRALSLVALWGLLFVLV